MNRKEIGWEDMDWIYLPENREDGICCERGSEPLYFIICRGFSRPAEKLLVSREGLCYISFQFITLHYIILHGVSLFCGSITLSSLDFEVKTVAVISMLHILSIVASKGNNRWTVQLVR